MENKKEKSIFNKNWLWLILIIILLSLTGILISHYRTGGSGQGDGSGDVGGQLPDPPPPAPPSSVNIVDPSPVFKDSAFTFALINDYPTFKKSYFIDGNEICMGQKTCVAKIRKLGKHTLKICLDDLSLCDTINIVVQPLGGIDNGMPRSSVSESGGGDVKVATGIVDKQKEGVLVSEGSKERPIVSDHDGDGLIDSKDNCPKRAGSNNGCPEYNIQIPSEGFIDENFAVKIGGDFILPSDNIDWQTGSGIQKTILGRDLEATGSVVGKYSIAVKINNPDGFSMSVPGKNIHLKIRNSSLGSLFRPIFVYGSAISSKSTNLAALKSNSDAAKNLIKKHILGGTLTGANVYDKSGGLVNDLDTFINADILGGTIKGGLNVKGIVYDTKNTGKITQIHLQ